MNSAVGVDRLQFAFTLTFHYLFPQLTMGLALVILILKTIALRTGDAHYDQAARFWARIFGISFALGVVTGVPMEFQFGTNWAAFSRAAGGVVGQTLAMEGIFSFFLESTFLGLLLFGEKRLSRIGHWFSALAVFVGSWLSGYLIIATNAWMQHPLGFRVGPAGEIILSNLWQVLVNPWALWQYAHNMSAAVITGSVAVAAVGAFYLLAGRDTAFGRTFVRVGVIAGLFASLVQVFPTGDAQGRLVAEYQPPTLAGMEGLFETRAFAPLIIVGQPDVVRRTLDNSFVVPSALSFLTYRRWSAQVRGLDAFPEADWPDQLPLLYYSYHIMVGLGTIFIAVLALAFVQLRRGRLFTSKSMLWVLMLLAPLPYVATTAGWVTAEEGRQPWVIYGLMRTSAGISPRVSSGNAWFTLLGFMGLYTVLAMLYLFLVYREIDHGPEALPHGE